MGILLRLQPKEDSLMPRRTPIRPEDIYEIHVPTDCQLSPDGRRVATAVARADRDQLKNTTHLWIAEVGGAREPSCAQFTQGKHSERMPRWSSDGKTIAFLSTRSERTELWIMPADGGEGRQLTKLEGVIGEFAWSPDGRKLVAAFTARDLEVKEREARKKRGEPGAEAPLVRVVGRLSYKLDGSGFLPQSRTHLFIIDAVTGKARRLTGGNEFSEGEPCFSPDGKWVYFTSNRTADPDRFADREDIWRIPARGGVLEKIRTFGGPAGEPSISPDGRWIAFLGKKDADEPWNQRHTKLWVTPTAGGRPVCLTERLDRTCRNTTISDTAGTGGSSLAVWSPDSRQVYFLVSNEGRGEIWRVGLRDRAPEPMVQAHGQVLAFSIDFEREVIHAAWSDLENPGEIRSFPLPLAGPAVRGRRPSRRMRAAPDGTAEASGSQLPAASLVRSAFNTGWLARRELAVPEEVWFTGKRNHALQGWILAPRRRNRARKGPAVLYIHGGPATQYGCAFFHEFQVLAARGYTVFYSNPRGGTGYSEKHLNAIVGKWGTIDYDDLMSFTDVALRRAPHVDRKRVAVAGGSYGGYMTNWIIGHTNRFACAITSRSISNFLSFVGTSDFGYLWPKEFGSGGPWEARDRYLRMSPLYYLENMRTPTLIEHQEEDHRCPIEQAEQLWTALKWKGVPVAFLRYPGEPHGMSRGGRPDRRIDRLERIHAWLEEWTKPVRRGARKTSPRTARKSGG
jgi:dipeptidyl aminopeptidase/acylaminoacyl peptidase